MGFPRNKRPVWYTDWRSLWHQACIEIGMSLSMYSPRFGGFDGRRVRMSRNLWKSLHRIRRIYRRLRAESKVMDHTWCDQLMKSIFRDGVDLS